ncbi:MAG: hypothetical protein HZA25_00785 [Candidatus Niyogibacteria bacterium]|nr:hypothetical protein [Candidatus Niyogibacteria bacterium]
MTIIPAIFFLIFLAAYIAITAIVFGHLKEYASPHDPYRWVSLTFLIAIGIFLLISIILFFSVDWETLLSSLGNIFYVPTRY